MINDIIFRAIAVVIGYFCGIFVSGYFIAKKRDVDIRKQGSGNVGTTNTLRTLGPRAGGMTLVFDALKPAIAMLIVYLIFHFAVGYEYYKVLMMYACVGTILGHDFPFFLHFKGGKGIACSVAMVVIMFPQVFPYAFIVFIVIVLLTKFVSLGSILGSISYLVLALYFASKGELNFPTENYTEILILTGFCAALAVFQHRSNIVRLVKGEENKLVLKMRKPDGSEENE